MQTHSQTAIRVEHLYKDFKIYPHPSDLFKEILTGKPHHKIFPALKDISFEVPRGSVVGILGRNGAGKSTLLKIISGTLDKTSGLIEVKGRIASILELGTGFNPEYTGRENIYLGGLMVGLSRKEIKDKEDWIIEFSELEDFIDQPFKTYSSGMQARLTFATAVCVEPEILIVDEALAVGDARFSRKSFAQIEKFRDEGRTILLVSHDSNQVASFCDYGMILEHGKIYDQGLPSRLRGVYYDLLFGAATELEPLPEITSVSEDEGSEPPEIDLDSSKFEHESGFCWYVSIPIEGDNTENPTKSAYQLCEDGTPVGKGHEEHEAIRQTGRGSFSHWGRTLYFSSRDNSDPKVNGRAYSLKREDLIEEPSRTGESSERKSIRQAALKKIGLKKAFEDRENARTTKYGNGKAEIIDFGIVDEDGKKVVQLVSGNKYTLYSKAVFYEPVNVASAGFSINNTTGLILYGVTSMLQNQASYDVLKGEIIETKVSVQMWLTNGTYFLTVSMADPFAEVDVQYDRRLDALQFDIVPKDGIFTTSVVDLNESLSVIRM